jgi:hypothetical protein
MNFDGQALVVNQDIEVFYSENGSAIVVPVNAQCYNYALGESNVDKLDIVFNNEKCTGEAIVTSQESYNFLARIPFVLSETIKTGRYGLVPFTAQIYTKNESNWKDVSFPSETTYVTNDSEKHEEICKSEIRLHIYDALSRYNNNEYKCVTAKIHDIAVPSNLYILNDATAYTDVNAYINDITAYIIDGTKSDTSKNFASVSATIIDKTEIVVPPPSKGYQDMFLVVQKNHFIELRLSDTIIDVTGLPEGLEYSLNAIKGIVEKSGSYDIRIQYQENSQKLNIIVPYYERTL